MAAVPLCQGCYFPLLRVPGGALLNSLLPNSLDKLECEWFWKPAEFVFVRC